MEIDYRCLTLKLSDNEINLIDEALNKYPINNFYEALIFVKVSNCNKDLYFRLIERYQLTLDLNITLCKHYIENRFDILR